MFFRGVDNVSFNEYARFNTNGYLGIGTSAPAEEIHIASDFPTIRLQDTDGTNQYSNVYHAGSAVYLDARNGTAKGFTIFRGVDGTNPAVEYARFAPNGNLGIGTQEYLGINPVVPLHIAADDPISARIRIQDGDGTNQYSDFLQSVGALYIDSRNNTNNGPIIFRGFNGEYGRFTTAGNLGVGVSSPTEKLHVVGNILATGSVTADSLSVTNQISGAQVQPEFTANNTATFGTPTGNVHLEVGSGATANRFASVDLVGDATNTDYGTRFYRDSGGVNGGAGITHKGTGSLRFQCETNSVLEFYTDNALRGSFRVNDGRFILNATGSRGASGAVITTSNDTVANAIRQSGYIEWTTDIGAVGTNYFVSDVNLKANIIDSTASASDVINNISFKEFDWKPESGQEGHVDIGVVAQQVAEVEPRLTRTLSDGKMSINESTFMTYTAKALQEALGRIEQLEAQVAALQG